MPGEPISIYPELALDDGSYDIDRIIGAATSPLVTIVDADGKTVASKTLEYG